MAVEGRLEDLSVRELLQLVAMLRKTGKLLLSHSGGTGLLAFRQGKVVLAGTDSARETLGNMLVCARLISEVELQTALDVQARSPKGTRLGDVLVEMGAVSSDELTRTIAQETERVLAELLLWREGSFSYEAVGLPAEEGDVGLDLREVLPSLGVPVAVMSAAGELAQPAAPPAASLTSLKNLMSQLRSPQFTGEITMAMMRYAKEVVRRGVLFVVRHEGFAGMAQFGLSFPGASGDERVRSLKLPSQEGFVLTRVATSQKTFRGPLQAGYLNDFLVSELGGERPDEAVAIPLVVSERVAAVFYGDNVTGGEPIGAVDGLELMMIQVGLAMEKQALQSRIKARNNHSQTEG